jgi:hypothetical protein
VKARRKGRPRRAGTVEARVRDWLPWEVGRAIRALARIAATLLTFTVASWAGWSWTGLSSASGPAIARAVAADAVRVANAPAAPAHFRVGAKRAPSSPPKRAPSSPPLTAAGSGGGGVESGSSASAISSDGDPLVSNGLGSPMCRTGPGEADLSRVSQRNCRTSGFEAAPAPTGNYAFDVHVNTGIAKWNNDAAAMFLNLIQLAWTVLVAAVHGVIVMIEWCYTIDLLNSAAMSGVAAGLREMQTAFTQPWLAAVLAVASVLALYQGLIRRRVAETVGQALLMLAMMVGGLWVIVDPTGTVGSLAQWANEAGFGALGAVAGGTPEHPDRTLADTMGDVFGGAIGRPWCFMEFGNVEWCSDPARLDPRLRAAGLAVAVRERAQVGCPPNASPFTACARPGSEQARALSHSVDELRVARTNGELFLALPANQAMRNSINDPGSLFNVLCGGSETPCKGPTAAQAEFRTEHGTAWRFMGLVFIWAGVLGMLLLLGFIAMHLFGAAIASLLYLLLAPVAVLAPALGDGGRTAFREWATRLLGAVMSKLIYSLLLGVVLLMERILALDLTALGWFTQWLLISTMWWGVFCQRQYVLGLARGEHGPRRESQPLTRRVGNALETPRAALRGLGTARRKLSKPAPSVASRRGREEAARERARLGADEQVGRALESEERDAAARVQAAPEIQERLSAQRTQLQRVRRAREQALESGNTRRAVELGHRAQRIEGEIGHSQQGLSAARQVVSDGERARRKTGDVYTREQVRERDRFLDAQAALPADARARASRAEERRDYAALAGLVGYGRDEYDTLAPRAQRAARLEVDRELALRKELNATARELAAGGGASMLGRRERRKMNEEFDRTLEARMRDGGHDMPFSRVETGFDAWRRDRRADRGSGRARESNVTRDAREVAARRKRQLGTGSER